MTFVLALETPNGGLATFTSPVPWDSAGPTVVVNGRTRTTGYAVTSDRTVALDLPPALGDVVGFMVST